MVMMRNFGEYKMNNHLWFSVGDIGRMLGMPLHQVNYYLNIFSIAPTIKIAGKRVFSREVVDIFATMIAENKWKRHLKKTKRKKTTL